MNPENIKPPVKEHADQAADQEEKAINPLKPKIHKGPVLARRRPLRKTKR